METTLNPTPTTTSADARFDVVVVSAFGRGNWLASHLSEQDWRVVLVDVTPTLGEWEPADWDGPFGLFESDALLASQKRQWLQAADSENDFAASGFTFWLPSGPLEGHGELSGFLSSQHDVSPESRAYLQLLNDVDDGELRRERSGLRRRKFRESWLAHLAHQVAANVYEDNDVALSVGRAIPFYAPYFQRVVHGSLLEDGLRVCEQRGVRVIRRASIASVHFDGSWPSREWTSLRLTDGSEMSGHAGVWALSSAETETMNATLMTELFPKGKREPSWCWLRFEMSVASSRMSESMPSGFALVGDIFLPWTHANLAHVRKHHAAMSAGGRRQGLDVWARVPVGFRFDRAYLENVQRDLLLLLQAKLPAADAQPERLPLELDRGAEALRAPRWPVYEGDSKVAAVSLKNFSVDGPEQWRGLDPLAQFQSQKKILGFLENQKRLRDERTARVELREQKRKARREARDVRQQARAGQRAQERAQKESNDD